MAAAAKLAVVIPAYNEAATIRDVAERALAQCETVIVVDDGSTDQTLERLEGVAVTLLRNPTNAGKAASLWRGMQAAMAQGCEGVITLDGDGQHDPADIPRLAAALERYPQHVVIAARLANRENAPRARLFANNFADFWIAWAAGQWVHDSQSGFRLYPTRLLAEAVSEQSLRHGFVFESEILIEAARRGYPVCSVPVASIYRHDARPSHFRPVADITLIVRMVAWKLFRWGMYPQGLWRAVRTRREGVVKEGREQ
ncbi:MAG: glycosyltransferase family 2 protein [Pseudomonadota bacterium]